MGFCGRDRGSELYRGQAVGLDDRDLPRYRMGALGVTRMLGLDRTARLLGLGDAGGLL